MSAGKLLLGIACMGGLLGVSVLAYHFDQAHPPPARQPTAQAANPPRTGVPSRPSATPLPAIGVAVPKGRWEVTVLRAGTLDDFGLRAPSGTPQGRYLVLEIATKNLHTATSNYTTNDVSLFAPDGRQFKPITLTQANVLYITQQVQPGLAATKLVVFDVDPSVTRWRARILDIDFAVAA